jgi:hypothetical protein
MSGVFVGKRTDEEELFSWSSVLRFDLFLLAALILSTRAATFLHELVGHALTAKAFGGQVDGIQVSLLGGGRVLYDLDAQSGLFVHFLVAFGGIVTNAISGFLSFLFVRRLHGKPAWALFLILFGMVSLLGAVAYSAIGFYYQEGDPVSWTDETLQHGEWLWIPFLVIFPVVSYLAVHSYLIINEQLFPTKTFLGRVVMIAVTLGISACAYAGLYKLTGQRSVVLDAQALARQRAENEVRNKKMEELYRKVRDSNPGLSEGEIQRLVEHTPVVVEPNEIPQRFPLVPVMALLYVGGALLAIRRVKLQCCDSVKRLAPLHTILTVSLAGAVLALLAWTGGWIYHS